MAKCRQRHAFLARVSAWKDTWEFSANPNFQHYNRMQAFLPSMSSRVGKGGNRKFLTTLQSFVSVTKHLAHP